MDKYFDANRPCQAVSKQFIKHYKPEKPTLLIAINDFNDQFKPFNERVNYLTYSNYVDVCWLFFDDIGYIPFGDKSLNMFTKKKAKELIQFLDNHFETKDFERVLVHCYAGVSRSQAVALFIAKYYLKDQDLFEGLYHQEGKVTGGNHFVYSLLEKTYEREHHADNL